MIDRCGRISEKKIHMFGEKKNASNIPKQKEKKYVNDKKTYGKVVSFIEKRF